VRVAGGYTPWPFIPNMSQTLFFLTLWFISSGRESRHLATAALVGAAIGVTFLAHPVPGTILTLVVIPVTFAARGLRVETVLWLAVVAVIQERGSSCAPSYCVATTLWCCSNGDRG
jgi:hypothetical protein